MGKATTEDQIWQGARAIEGRHQDFAEALGKALGLRKKTPEVGDGLAPPEAIASDSAGVALWSMQQVGEHLDVNFDLVEDLIRLREGQLPPDAREGDAVLEDLERVQAELLKSKDEVLSCLEALVPGGRNPSKALGLADSLVGRLDLLTAKIEAMRDEARSRGLGFSAEEQFLAGLERASEDLWGTQQEAAFAFLEIFEATW